MGRGESAAQSMGRGSATSSRSTVGSVTPFSSRPTAYCMRPVAVGCMEVLGESVTRLSDRALLAENVALVRPQWGIEALERESMKRACVQGWSSKHPAECPKWRPHWVISSRPVSIIVVLTMSAGSTPCDVTCASPSAVQVCLRASSLGAIGCTTSKLAVRARQSIWIAGRDRPATQRELVVRMETIHVYAYNGEDACVSRRSADRRGSGVQLAHCVWDEHNHRASLFLQPV